MKTDADNGERDRVYYDTNIWVSYILGEEDNFYRISKPMIDAVEQERSVAIISSLIIAELIHAIRRTVSQKQPTEGGMTPSGIESTVKEITDDFVKIIGRFERQGKAIRINKKNVAVDHPLLLTKLAALTGYARRECYCRKCKVSYTVRDNNTICPSCDRTNEMNKKYTYRGLGHLDLEHVYFAIHGHASIFYTRDKGFSTLKNDPDFNSISFRLL